MSTGVSAVVTVHRGARYLRETLGAILAERALLDEVVVLDDGPDDGSEAIAREQGSIVRYLRRRDEGPGEARNAGIRAARGGLLAFCDQDDLWAAGRLEAQRSAFAADGALEAVFGHVDEFVSPDVPSGAALRRPARGVPGWVPGAMLIRREALERVGPFVADLRVGEWFEWFARARDLGLRMGMLEGVVLRRRLHADNRTHREAGARGEYARVLHASLRRRRAGG